jgi:hypothetical protein
VQVPLRGDPPRRPRRFYAKAPVAIVVIAAAPRVMAVSKDTEVAGHNGICPPDIPRMAPSIEIQKSILVAAIVQL